jgi:nucleoside diphosphate kinase
MYAENKQNNIIHASDGQETAKAEIAFFFSQKELIENKLL